MTQTALSHGGDWVSDTMDYQEYYRSGYRFALRYVVPSVPGKMVTAIEVSSAHAAGIDVGFVYETTGRNWQGGMTAGIDDGIAAQNAMLSINAPRGTAVYHAVDSPVSQAELPTVIQWVAGLIKGMPDYTVGVYGQYSVIAKVANRYPSVLLWQTIAWSDGNTYPVLDMMQGAQVMISGIIIDTDLLYISGAGAGLWLHDSPPPPPRDNDMDNSVSQANWKFCSKCGCLNYEPKDVTLKCAGGGVHDNSSSGNYLLTYITGPTPVD